MNSDLDQLGQQLVNFRNIWMQLNQPAEPDTPAEPAEPTISTSHCRRCGRVLTAPESVATGIGPVCVTKPQDH